MTSPKGLLPFEPFDEYFGEKAVPTIPIHGLKEEPSDVCPHYCDLQSRVHVRRPLAFARGKFFWQADIPHPKHSLSQVFQKMPHSQLPDRTPGDSQETSATTPSDRTEVREPCIYLVDDDEGVRLSMQALLNMRGYRTKLYANGTELLHDLSEVSYGCLVVDFKMPRNF